MQLPKEEIHIVGSRGVNDFSSISRADDEAVAGKARKVGREGVLPDIQPSGQYPGGQSRRGGKQFLQRAQTRDVTQGGKTLRKINFIHPSRLVDMRDKRVTIV